jgi:hypothetical protein
MANVRIVLAQGAIDGSNRVFATGEPYVPGSTAYILNGRIHNLKAVRGPENDYGYIELSADAGTIEVDIPPLPDDVVQIFFWSRVVIPPPAIERLTGVIGAREQVQGVIREPTKERLVGVVRKPGIVGIIRAPNEERLVGQAGVVRMTGVIREKCS